jgi:hypothetical protein
MKEGPEPSAFRGVELSPLFTATGHHIPTPAVASSGFSTGWLMQIRKASIEGIGKTSRYPYRRA